MSGDFKLGVLIGLLILALMVIFLTNKPRTDELASESASTFDQKELFIPEEDSPVRDLAAVDAAEQETAGTEEPAPSSDPTVPGETPAATESDNELVITQHAGAGNVVGGVMGGSVPRTKSLLPADAPATGSQPDTEDKAATEKPGVEDTTFPLQHVVQKGETLSTISAKYYGTHKLYYHIYKANRRILSGPNAVFPKQKISIPAPPAKKVSRPKATAKKAIVLDKAKTPAAKAKHTVKKGQSLCEISRIHFNGDESKWKKILEANKDRIKDPNRLPVGLTLIIPSI